MTYKYGVGRIGEVVWKSYEVGDVHFTKCLWVGNNNTGMDSGRAVLDAR